MRQRLIQGSRRGMFGPDLLCAAVLLAGQAASAQTREWEPRRTWVYVVGTLKWKYSDVFESFPPQNRRDAQLVSFFRGQGVPAEQIIYLQDAQATTAKVKSSFASFLAKAGEGDFLFVYYTGHGYKSNDGRTTFFATYDAGEEVSGWSTESIVRDIDRFFRGSRAFLTADSCYSGSLVDQVRLSNHRISYASLTSSSANKVSTENWTFTEMLLAGLSGRSFADMNGDAKVTLGELAEDIREDMDFAEGQRSSFVATGVFSRDTVLAPAERKSAPEVSRRVEVKPNGEWYRDWYKARIIDVLNGKFKIHYFGWEDSDDEWVRSNQIRNLNFAHGDRGISTRTSR